MFSSKMYEYFRKRFLDADTWYDKTKQMNIVFHWRMAIYAAHTYWLYVKPPNFILNKNVLSTLCNVFVMNCYDDKKKT